MRPYRCVKCAQPHKTADCPKKDRSTPATCALCLGAHPANYKGCEVYREISSRKFKKQTPNRRTMESLGSKRTETIPQTMASTVGERNHSSTQKTYAEVIRNSPAKNDEKSEKIITHNKLELLFEKQSEKIDVILQQMSTLLSLITNLLNKLTK